MLTSTMTRLGLGLLAGLMFLGVAAPAAIAGPHLKVSVVHARKAPGPADPALKGVQGQLERAFSGYKSFKELAKHDLKLQAGKPSSLVLPNRKQARFDYQGLKGKTHQVAMTIDQNKIDLRIPEKRLFFQAGLKHKDGILVLALYLK